ncbi:MAG: helix-turn-helix transcriptional regulator [Clostridia bacterium]|nr:helix-turn-helix transcriptional regulator [Clostridia bacterium]
MKLLPNQKLTYAEQRVRLEIAEISYGLLDSEWEHEDLRAAFTRVYIPLEGEGFIRVNGENICLCPGNIYVVPSELSFSCFCPEKLNKIYIHLTLTKPDGVDVFAGIPFCMILKNCEARSREIEALYEGNDIRSVLRLKLLLYEILEEALQSVSLNNEHIKSYSEYTKRALSYIDTHLNATMTINEISSALFISKLVLQKHFKMDLGKPIGKYIDQCLMARAERELLDRSLSIKDISEHLGFCDQFYFSRKFSEHHGVSPRRFRQMHNI